MIELMIALVVVGLLAALASPSFTTAFERQKFRGGNSALLSNIKTARSYAVSTKDPHGVYVSMEDRTYTVFRDVANLGGRTFDAGDSVIAVDTLPIEFELLYTDAENGVFIFNANGSADFTGTGRIITYGATAETVSLSQIEVLAATGRVKIEAAYY
jgi:Tfp pilus assembly protein FimT